MSVCVLLPLPSALTRITNFSQLPPTTVFKTKKQQQIKSMMPSPDPATTIIPSADDEDEEIIILPDDFVPRKNDGTFPFLLARHFSNVVLVALLFVLTICFPSSNMLSW